MIIKGILFDFNGTMFYDGQIQETSWRSYLKSKIGREVTEKEFQEYVHGRNADDTLQYFLNRKLSKTEIEQIAEEKEVTYRELCLKDKDRFKLAEGLEEFLDYLKKNNIPCTIATASGIKNVRFFFEHLNLAKWFDINKVVYDDGTIKGKPEPEIYLRAAEKIKIPIKECMVFEDAKSGIIAADRAGACKVIGVCSSICKKDMSGINGVDKIIENYIDAKQLLIND